MPTSFPTLPHHGTLDCYITAAPPNRFRAEIINREAPWDTVYQHEGDPGAELTLLTSWFLNQAHVANHLAHGPWGLHIDLRPLPFGHVGIRTCSSGPVDPNPKGITGLPNTVSLAAGTFTCTPWERYTLAALAGVQFRLSLLDTSGAATVSGTARFIAPSGATQSSFDSSGNPVAAGSTVADVIRVRDTAQLILGPANPRVSLPIQISLLATGTVVVRFELLSSFNCETSFSSTLQITT